MDECDLAEMWLAGCDESPRPSLLAAAENVDKVKNVIRTPSQRNIQAKRYFVPTVSHANIFFPSFQVHKGPCTTSAAPTWPAKA